MSLATSNSNWYWPSAYVAWSLVDCWSDEMTRERYEEITEMLKLMLPIVEEAYWDHYTAFRLPGAGYTNKAQSLAGSTWGKDRWSSKEFELFVSNAKALLSR